MTLYHVHLACVANDPVLYTAQDDLAIFVEKRALLTQDLRTGRSRSANYGWRCVNACDAVVLMIGGRYGQLNPSGVSQLHLSYSNARTTKKPIVALIHSDALESEDRSLTDFIKLLQTQIPESIHYFDESRNLFSIFEATLGKFFLQHQEEHHEQLHDQQKVSAVKSDTLKPLLFNVPRREQLSEIRAKKSISMDAKQPALSWDNEFSVNCTAHAFQGGTLIEVAFSLEITWRQIIAALIAIDVPFSSQGLMRCLNEQIDKDQVNDIVMSKYPQVHAISRYQVLKTDALWIQDELQLAGHIAPKSPNGAWALWEVTAATKDFFQPKSA